MHISPSAGQILSMCHIIMIRMQFPPLKLLNDPVNARQPYNFPLYFHVKFTCLCHTCFPTVTLCEYFNNIATGSKSGQLWRGLSSKMVCVALCTLSYTIVYIVCFDFHVLIVQLKHEHNIRE